RSLAANNLSIFGDHQDVMSARQTGFTMLASSNVQQTMDLAAVAHLAAIKSSLPVLHFFDGFRTSHEIQKIKALEYEELDELLDYDALEKFRARAKTPNNPTMINVTTNEDITFQMREAVNPFHDRVPEIVQDYMDKIGEIQGEEYKLYNYYGHPEAEDLFVVMGAAADTIRGVVEALCRNGEKVGLIDVHLFRPFAVSHFLKAAPETVKRVSVLDRTKEPGSAGEPLYLEVRNAFYTKENTPLIVGGRFGLASKEFEPNDVLAILENMRSENPINGFTVGIEDDVTNKSLPKKDYEFNTVPEGTVACKFWGYGSDGTVGANKSTIKIIGNNTDKYVQAYFAYDAKKSGGTTVSHLRFGEEPIHEPYLVNQADFIAVHKQAYVQKYDVLKGIKEGGVFLLNTIWSVEELEKELPDSLKKEIAEKNVEFYTINADDLADSIGLSGRTNMIMQSAFFKLADIMEIEKAVEYMYEEIVKSYGSKGEEVVNKNKKAIQVGLENIVKIEVPAEWKNLEAKSLKTTYEGATDFVNEVIEPINRLQGDSIPVSAFKGVESGVFPTGTTKYEKREVSNYVSCWDSEKCIQCNQCSFVCPHAVIRPFLYDEEEANKAPNKDELLDAKGKPGYKYAMVVSGQDCTGCTNCVNVCPTKALEMTEFKDKREEYIDRWNYAMELPEREIEDKEKFTLKGSQFSVPLQEFSGACAGCGETPYAKLVTQLYGDRMMISNSAGCSTVWGGSAQMSYTYNKKGQGPAWTYSLFEDNAEFGLGIYKGVKKLRDMTLNKAKALIEQEDLSETLKVATEEWIKGFGDSKDTRKRADAFEEALKENGSEAALDLLKNKDYFIKRSHWIFGGDGWAYDIGYGGLDHVLASGENINILVFDTEVYSNTGGQSSKSTPTAAVAKFAANGKRTRKKDLGRMAMTYGYVYVAQIAMGANRNQALKAIVEAEAYDGPSIVICYSPCINHGIKGGLKDTQGHQKLAVESGYWNLYRYNPNLEKEGKNPFQLDSKAPTKSFRDFIMTENRYSSLTRTFPEVAEELFEQAEKDAMERYKKYVELSEA
ncbi:MAG: pyruvate:ferredoxin (flavodoxin) oxidoreductase, partial [Peptoniphilus sp.]|nr:pyruvate:ferredoxin (flavodoxin) oxidoreductase [Peptoniphilus sp.]